MIGEYLKQDARPTQMYWKAKGTRQGDMHNKCTMKGYESYSKVIGIQWGLSSLVDTQTGHRQGKRQLEGLVITKPLDTSSVSLLQAMIQNEVIKDSEFLYVDFPGGKVQTGQMAKIFTIQTADGFINKIEAGSTAEGALIERIHLWFNSITWTHNIETTSTTDNRVET